jgi:hypothetical protein
MQIYTKEKKGVVQWGKYDIQVKSKVVPVLN